MCFVFTTMLMNPACKKKKKKALAKGCFSANFHFKKKEKKSLSEQTAVPRNLENFVEKVFFPRDFCIFHLLNLLLP